MSKVIIDDTSLNGIANSIRQKNGLVRTYRPEEMADAIRAFRTSIPTSHEYTVTITQTENQTINVRKYMNEDVREYTSSFTVSEPFYNLDITVTPYGGCVEGALNYLSSTVLDRDLHITATPATAVQERTAYAEIVSTSTGASGYSGNRFDVYIGDNIVTREQVEGKNVIITYRDSDPITNARKVLGWGSNYENNPMSYPKSVYIDLDTSNANYFIDCFQGLLYVKYITLGNSFQTFRGTSFEDFFYACHQLRKVNIMNLDFSEAREINSFFNECYLLNSVCFPTCESPYLYTISSLFSNCRYLQRVDISGLDTSSVTTNANEFNNCGSLEYIVIDYPSIRKNHSFSGVPSSCKILVPSNLVSDYQQEYPSHSSKFDDIANYTVTRSDGEVFVTPNIY